MSDSGNEEDIENHVTRRFCVGPQVLDPAMYAGVECVRITTRKLTKGLLRTISGAPPEIGDQHVTLNATNTLTTISATLRELRGQRKRKLRVVQTNGVPQAIVAATIHEYQVQVANVIWPLLVVADVLNLNKLFTLLKRDVSVGKYTRPVRIQAPPGACQDIERCLDSASLPHGIWLCKSKRCLMVTRSMGSKLQKPKIFTIRKRKELADEVDLQQRRALMFYMKGGDGLDGLDEEAAVNSDAAISAGASDTDTEEATVLGPSVQEVLNDTDPHGGEMGDSGSDVD